MYEFMEGVCHVVQRSIIGWRRKRQRGSWKWCMDMFDRASKQVAKAASQTMTAAIPSLFSTKCPA